MTVFFKLYDKRRIHLFMLHVCTCTYSVCAGTFICTISPTEAVKLLEKVVKDREKILYKYNRQLGAAYNMLARALAMQGQTACSH